MKCGRDANFCTSSNIYIVFTQSHTSSQQWWNIILNWHHLSPTCSLTYDQYSKQQYSLQAVLWVSLIIGFSSTYSQLSVQKEKAEHCSILFSILVSYSRGLWVWIFVSMLVILMRSSVLFFSPYRDHTLKCVSVSSFHSLPKLLRTMPPSLNCA